jgi:hypothetical protein
MKVGADSTETGLLLVWVKTSRSEVLFLLGLWAVKEETRGRMVNEVCHRGRETTVPTTDFAPRNLLLVCILS